MWRPLTALALNPMMPPRRCVWRGSRKASHLTGGSTKCAVLRWSRGTQAPTLSGPASPLRPWISLFGVASVSLTARSRCRSFWASRSFTDIPSMVSSQPSLPERSSGFKRSRRASESKTFDSIVARSMLG